MNKALSKGLKTVSSGLLGAAAVAGLLAGGTGKAMAEAKEVRFAEQFGLLYLPLQVVVSQKLVEAQAKKMGLGDVKVTMHKFSGGAAVNQALLSGSVDFAAGGVGPLLKIWDRTYGTDNEVRAMNTMSDMPLKLVTNDKRVKKIEDYVGLTDHKIATPSVKSSIQAVTLQMICEKVFGPGQQFKLDDMVVSMPHPQAVAATLSGGQPVKSHFSTLPFSFQQLTSGKTHLVISSYDFFGGPHTIVSLYNTKKWKEANPKLFKAVSEAYFEAHKWINADLKRAAGIYKTFTKSKLELKDLEKMVGDKNEISYDPAPRRTMKYAEFLHKIKDLKNMPKSWKDYYWENTHHLNGS